MDIVPGHERLLVDTQTHLSDIDVVAGGGVTEVRLTALLHRHVLPLEGRLLSVSADRMVDDKSQRVYFLGRIELNEGPNAAHHRTVCGLGRAAPQAGPRRQGARQAHHRGSEQDVCGETRQRSPGRQGRAVAPDGRALRPSVAHGATDSSDRVQPGR